MTAHGNAGTHEEDVAARWYRWHRTWRVRALGTVTLLLVAGALFSSAGGTVPGGLRAALSAGFVLYAALVVDLVGSWAARRLSPAHRRAVRARRAATTEGGQLLASGAVPVDAPVAGRWKALNSPATKVPSHGTDAYGQTYAIDIVAAPAGSPSPSFALLWPPVRRAEEFPAYGRPVLACADGTVISASDRIRGGRFSRNSLPALALFLVEGVLRSMAGPRRVTGNHVTLDLGGGLFAEYAHLRRGSLRVAPGDTVRAGQELAECGNTGNSTEPHLHFQLMDGPDLHSARGIPFTWRGVGVPANGEEFEVPPAEAHRPAGKG